MMFYGLKKLIQLSLKPKNPNLSSKSQRGLANINNLRASKRVPPRVYKKKKVLNYEVQSLFIVVKGL